MTEILLCTNSSIYQLWFQFWLVNKCLFVYLTVIMHCLMETRFHYIFLYPYLETITLLRAITLNPGWSLVFGRIQRKSPVSPSGAGMNPLSGMNSVSYSIFFWSSVLSHKSIWKILIVRDPVYQDLRGVYLTVRNVQVKSYWMRQVCYYCGNFYSTCNL